MPAHKARAVIFMTTLVRLTNDADRVTCFREAAFMAHFEGAVSSKMITPARRMMTDETEADDTDISEEAFSLSTAVRFCSCGSSTRA